MRFTSWWKPSLLQKCWQQGSLGNVVLKTCSTSGFLHNVLIERVEIVLNEPAFEIQSILHDQERHSLTDLVFEGTPEGSEGASRKSNLREQGTIVKEKK